MNARKVRTAVGLGEIGYGSMIHVDQGTIALKGSKSTGFLDRDVVNRTGDEDGGRLSIMMMVQVQGASAPGGGLRIEASCWSSTERITMLKRVLLQAGSTRWWW